MLSANTDGNSLIVSATALVFSGEPGLSKLGLTFLLVTLEGGPLPGERAPPSDAGGPPAALGPLLGGPLGGGGVGAEAAGASAPAFLLTHFLRVAS